MATQIARNEAGLIPYSMPEANHPEERQDVFFDRRIPGAACAVIGDIRTLRVTTIHVVIEGQVPSLRSSRAVHFRSAIVQDRKKAKIQMQFLTTFEQLGLAPYLFALQRQQANAQRVIRVEAGLYRQTCLDKDNAYWTVNKLVLDPLQRTVYDKRQKCPIPYGPWLYSDRESNLDYEVKQHVSNNARVEVFFRASDQKSSSSTSYDRLKNEVKAGLVAPSGFPAGWNELATPTNGGLTHVQNT